MPPARAGGHVDFGRIEPVPGLQEILRVEGIDPVEMNPAQVSSLAGDNQI
jgi:hypothetical protein